MSQFTELRDFCSEFETELALSPSEDGNGKNFELIVDFTSGNQDPEVAIEQVEQQFEVSIYPAEATQHEHSMSGEYVLALSS